jgi:hypothetical protein
MTSRICQWLIVASVTSTIVSISNAGDSRFVAFYSCNKTIARTAAKGVTGSSPSEDPLTLFSASLTLFRVGDFQAGIFWFHVSLLRMRESLVLHPAQGGIATSFTMAGMPITEYALHDTKSYATIVQSVLDWDARAPNPLRNDPEFAKKSVQLATLRDGLIQLRNKLLLEGPEIEAEAKARNGGRDPSSWSTKIGCEN